MRIPPLHRRPGWQRFLAGVIIGSLIGWGLFLYQFGNVHEDMVVELGKKEIHIEQLERNLESLREREQEEENDERDFVIEEISIVFENEEESRLSELALYDLQQQAMEELEHLLDEDVESVAENRELLVRTIENKRYPSNDYEYNLIVQQVTLYRTLEIHVEVVPVEDD
ncbi:sporulation membrane protein YtrI [Natribacillus halophilus]|uniref:Sporulation membrane protein YtrI C-terminal domain-containing protein n=1 Tax=Natribacillus halophilus TaxID=549003 RepID=A0A1G8NCX9_9BACI|nr:sporulation membrane protein YtrI [Natribacillus halophilus]SDI77946.1 hypothetical protein SAMN04488123_10612 [Natribacillus halophilus]